MDNKKRNVIITEEAIKDNLKVVAKKITEDYQGKNLYVLSLY